MSVNLIESQPEYRYMFLRELKHGQGFVFVEPITNSGVGNASISDICIHDEHIGWDKARYFNLTCSRVQEFRSREVRVCLVDIVMKYQVLEEKSRVYTPLNFDVDTKPPGLSFDD